MTTATPKTKRTTRPEAASPRRKTTAKRAKPRKKAATKKAPAKPAEETSLVRAFESLPDKVRNVTYIRRTRDILDKRRRRADRLRADTKKELVAVAEDFRSDVEGRVTEVRDQVRGRVEKTFDSARETAVGRKLQPIPGQIVGRFDGWLLEWGLVRSARLEDEVIDSLD